MFISWNYLQRISFILIDNSLKIPNCTFFHAMSSYLVIRIIGVTRNKDDANVRRWNRKIVNIIDPDATVKAPNVSRAIFVTSKSRDRPELPLRPALTLCPTIIRLINTSQKEHLSFSIHVICHWINFWIWKMCHWHMYDSFGYLWWACKMGSKAAAAF